MPSKLKAVVPELTQEGHFKAILYGPTGVGKTWLSLTFPGLYYMAHESGAEQNHYKQRLIDAGGRYLGPEHGTLDPEFVLGQMQALATEEHPYKTLVSDSITKIYQTIIAQSAESLGDKDVFGASKKPALAFMRRLINWTSRLDMNVIFIAHETTEWGIGPNGQRQEIGKVPDVWDKLAYELDLVLQAQKRGPNRVAIIKKSRLLGFPEGETFPLDYDEFAKRYGKQFIESPAKKLVLAAKEQVAEVNRLIELLKVPADEYGKWLTKAKAETFSEMDAATLHKCIEFLKSKIQ